MPITFVVHWQISQPSMLTTLSRSEVSPRMKIVTKSVWCLSNSKIYLSDVSLRMKIVTKSVWCLGNSKIYLSYVMLRMKIVTKSVWCLYSSKMNYLICNSRNENCYKKCMMFIQVKVQEEKCVVFQYAFRNILFSNTRLFTELQESSVLQRV